MHIHPFDFLAPDSHRARPGSVFATAALALCLLVLAGCEGEAPPMEEVVRPIKAVKVADLDAFGERFFPGQAKATQELELSFRVAGPLITRPVDVGTVVKEGDVVARIDPREYEVNLRSVQGQLSEGQAALKRAEADYRRMLSIQKEDPGAVSQSAVDRAAESRDRAKASIDSLAASVDAAKDQLDYTVLNAPFDGIVVATYVENFEDVRAKQPIVRIVDDSRIEMTISIPENLISYAPLVKNIEVTFDAFPDQPLPAEIKEIGNEASVTTRTYPMTLIMDQPQGFKILPGMAGTATGTAPAELDQVAVVVPVSAVFSPEDVAQSFVWIIDQQDKTVARREVKVGELTSRGLQILDGLAPGELIATAGVHYLREGQPVRPLEPDSK